MSVPGALGAIWLVKGWQWMARSQWSRALRKALVPIAMGLSASMVLILVQVGVDAVGWLLGVVVAALLIHRGVPVVWVIGGGALLGLLVGLA